MSTQTRERKDGTVGQLDGASPTERERGSALVMALITVVVISLVATALLGFTYTTSRSEDNVRERRFIANATDSAVDNTIQSMRYDLSAGRYSTGATSCPVIPSLNFDDPNLTGSNGGGAGLNDIAVGCTPLYCSGCYLGGSTILPENTLLALGGVMGPGNRDDGNGADDEIPFCDDRHAPSPCEASIYLGQGVTDDGGLQVVSNGNTYGTPIVAANGAIISRESDNENRRLNVAGTVFARRRCQNVTANYNMAGETSTPNPAAGSALRCAADTDPYWYNASLNNLMIPDPQWRHELWAKKSLTRDAETNVPLNGAGLHQLSTESLPLGTVPPLSDCNDGFVKFTPNTRYNSLAALEVFRDCASSTVWFPPGVYYFDFEDAAGPEFWDEFKHYAQIVGGTPKGWVECLPAASGGCPQTTQPTKVMVPNKLGTQAWPSSNDTDFYGSVIDDQWAQLQITDDTEVHLEPIKLVTKLPDAGVSVSKVVVRVRTELLSPSTQFRSGFPRLIVRATGPLTGECEIPLGQAATNARHQYIANPVDANNDGDYDDVTDSRGLEDIIDITAGCAGVGTFSGTAFPSNGSQWSLAEQVNGIKTRYEIDRLNSSVTPSFRVDGLHVQVDYKGPPTPSFPGGCDTLGDGVQWIFGNISRIKWTGNDVQVELCGPTDQNAQDPHAVAFYGLTANGVPPAYRLATSMARPLIAPNNTEKGKVGNFDPLSLIWVSTNDASAWPTTVSLYQKPNDGSYGLIDYSSGSERQLGITMPTNLIPAHSAIENVQMRVRYASPKLKNGAVNLPGGVDTMKLKLFTGDFPTGTDSGDPDGGSGGSLPEMNIPVCNQSTVDVSQLSNPTNATEFKAKNPNFQFCEYTYGDDWPSEGLILQKFRAANNLNNAELRLSFEGPNNRAIALIDSLELIVDYRPPGTLRPLRGCLTVRTYDDPTGAKGYQGTHLTFGPGSNANQWGYPYITHTDNTFGGGNVSADVNSCSLFMVKSNSSDFQEGTKTHINGSWYAPTAALALAGKDNDASFVTDGVVARHINAVRWKKGGKIPGFGGGTVRERRDRRVRLRAYQRYTGGAPSCVTTPTTSGCNLVADVIVRIKDNRGNTPGSEVVVERWIKKPQ